MAPPKRASFNVCFCDIDGTLVHYPETQAKWGAITGPSVIPGCFMYVEKTTGKRHKVLKLPPSTTGHQGVISINTLTELARMRKGGVKLVLITGARLSTLLMRMAFLPAADAYVCENGGRIFYPDPSLTVALPISEDMDWRKTHNAIAGPPDTDAVPPSERPGTLWELYKKLEADGWALDAFSYTTNFRMKADKDKTPEDVLDVVKSLKPGLASSFNIGLADFYPATSGKENAAKHIVEKFNTNLSEAFLLCDDDNDMGLAAVVGKVFLPSITSESVQRAVTANPDKFVVSQKGGIIATEEILSHVEDHIGTFMLG